MKSALAILLLLASRGNAASTDDVTWILPEFPPIFITEKELQGQGFGDGELRYLIQHLPQFHHLVSSGTAPRLWHEIEHRDGICTLSVAKLPEREKLAVFSARAVYGATNEVVVRTDKLARFAPLLDANGHIDLSRLAADGHLLGGYSDGITYGPPIDALIRDPQRKTPLELTAHMRVPMSLLDKERVDFVFGYYMEITYYRRIHQPSAEFTALPTTPESTRQDAYIACSNGPRGRQVIAAIDALLASDEAMLDYVENLRGWYSPAEFELAQKQAKSAGK